MRPLRLLLPHTANKRVWMQMKTRQARVKTKLSVQNVGTKSKRVVAQSKIRWLKYTGKGRSAGEREDRWNQSGRARLSQGRERNKDRKCEGRWWKTGEYCSNRMLCNLKENKVSHEFYSQIITYWCCALVACSCDYLLLLYAEWTNFTQFHQEDIDTFNWNHICTHEKKIISTGYSLDLV